MKGKDEIEIIMNAEIKEQLTKHLKWEQGYSWYGEEII